MALTTSTIQINFLQQPVDGDSFSYRITNNGIPLTYTSGVSNLFKLFKSSSTNNTGYIIGLDNNLEIDTDFNFGTGFNSLPFDIKYQSTGKAIVAGIFTSFDGSSAIRICRLNTDGTLDTSFSPPTFSSGNFRIDVDPNNDKIYVVGTFTSPYNRIARLNADGTLDTSFVVGTGFNEQTVCVKVQSDGKILVGGVFTAYKGTTRNKIIRLNTDGSIDNTFNIGSGFSTVSSPQDIAFTSDNKIVIVGNFSSYNGNAVRNIVRVSSTGAYDNTLVQGTGFNDTIQTVLVDNTNKIYCGGLFTSYSGITSNYVIKLNTNGSIDTGFNIGSGFNSGVNTMEFASDGDLVLGGLFSTYKGNSHSKLIKLDTNGDVDSTSVNLAYNGNVRMIAVNGTTLMVIGEFSTIFDSNPTQSQTRIPISTSGVTETQTNTYNNLSTFNIHADIVYSSVTNQVLVQYTHDEADIIIVDNVTDVPGFVEIVLPGNIASAATLILTRSPHFNVSSFTGGTVDTAQIDMRIWKGDYILDAPSGSTYSFQKQVVVTNQDTIYFNVANFLREFNQVDIDSYMQPFTTAIEPISIDTTTWAQIDTTTFYSGVTVNTFTTKYLSIDGYGWVEEGANPVPSNVFLTASEFDILRSGHSRAHFVTNGLNSIVMKSPSNLTGTTLSYTDPDTFQSNQYVMSLLVQNNDEAWVEYDFIYADGTITKKFNFIDECFYSPIELIFKNKYGVLQSIPFSKKSNESYDIQSKDFFRSTLTQQATYDPRRHSTVTYMLNGTKSITVNTHYVKDYFNLTMKELFHSEEIYLNDNGNISPVVIKDKSWNVKTNLNDKLIQYTLKLELAQNTINKII